MPNRAIKCLLTLIFCVVAVTTLTVTINAQAVPDFNIDPTFVSQPAGGQARAVALQPDGNFIVGGTFTSFASEARIGAVRMNADVSIDRAFTPNDGIAFGIGTDIPTAADYDGDGKADVAVFRNGVWYLNRTTAGFTGIAFGASTDLPTETAFVP